jgi:hypothetical protein
VLATGLALVAQDKPQPKVELSAADALKVREIQLRITTARLAQAEARERERKALEELQKVAQEIQQRTGCVLREDEDGKLACAEANAKKR